MIKYDLTKAVCRGKLHCTLCRAKDRGKRFREEVAQHLIEQVEVDFICPLGYEWDTKIEPEFMPALNKAEGPQKFIFQEGNQQPPPAQLNEDTELSKKRFEICKTCEHATENGHKCALYKGCCFGRWRAQPENKCPADPPKWDAGKKLETGN